jgi:hypothetical protein
MDLVRDVLDNQLVDGNGRKMGRADGIVLELREHRSPRVAAIECGLPALIGRLRWSWRERTLRWLAKLGIRRREPVRIDFAHVRHIGIDVELDVDADAVGALAWEHALRERVVGRLPGGQ